MQSPNTRLIQAWLELQCTMVQGAVRGAVLAGGGHSGSVDPIAVWPPRTLLTAPMLSAAKLALTEQRQVVEALALVAGSDVAQGCDVIATPLVVDNRAIGVVVMEMTARMQARQDAALKVLSWGGTWLETVIEHLNSGPNLRLNIVIETIAEAVKHEAFGAAAAAVANALGRLLECARVSVGFKDRDDLTIAAISNTARFEQRTNLVRSVAANMMEAIDQDRRIALPSDEAESMTLKRAHERHQAEFGSREIHTLPFSNDGKLVGAVTLERNEEPMLNREDIALAETVVSVVGPILYTKRNAQRPALKRIASVLGAELHRLVEPGHLSFKAGIVVLGGLCLLAALVRVDHDVKAAATLQGEIQRAVVAPFDGYVAEAPVRAGDVVASSFVMARLEDRDLRLERAKWAGERAQLTKAQRQALAKHDRAKLTILGAKLDKAEASLALAEEKLARAQIKAPIEGAVVSGDLSQSLGAPVKRGDLLFEVAPLDKYRIVLEVDERDIAHVNPGQTGQLALASLPHLKFAFTVDRIVPTSTAEEGRNFFAVEARLDEPADNLRPGMAGIGKIQAGRRPLIWIWTHRLSDRLRLLMWKWWG